MKTLVIQSVSAIAAAVERRDPERGHGAAGGAGRGGQVAGVQLLGRCDHHPPASPHQQAGCAAFPLYGIWYLIQMVGIPQICLPVWKKAFWPSNVSLNLFDLSSLHCDL